MAGRVEEWGPDGGVAESLLPLAARQRKKKNGQALRSGVRTWDPASVIAAPFLEGAVIVMERRRAE